MGNWNDCGHSSNCVVCAEWDILGVSFNKFFSTGRMEEMLMFSIEAVSINSWIDRNSGNSMEKTSTVPTFFIRADSEENARRSAFQILNIHKNPRIQITITKLERVE